MKSAIKIFDLFINLYFFVILSLFLADYSFIFSNGISNFSFQALIFACLFFLRWLIAKESIYEIFFVKMIEKITRKSDKVILISIFIFFVLVFSLIGIERHWAISSSGYDLAVTDQAVWNTTRGNMLFSSLDGNISHLGAHFEPILLLIVPFYMIWNNLIVLILLQSFALGLAIFPLYLIAKLKLKSRFLIFSFVIAYFLSRPVRGIGLLDFHTESFLVPLSLFSYYFLVTNRIKMVFAAIFLMLLCKENAAFLVIGFGIFSFLSLKKYKLGIFLFIIGIAAWLIETKLIIPYFANTNDYPYLVWMPFGKTYLENITAVIKNPFLIFNLAFGPGKIDFYLKLFGPIGFLSFLSPVHYVLFLIPLATQIIGSIRHPGMQTITSHYPAHTIPFIFIAAIYGIAWLLDKFGNSKARYEKISFYSAAYLIAFSLAFYGKSDGHKLSKFINGANEINSNEVFSALKIIPQDSSVCAVNGLVPHLSHRKFIYIWKESKEFKNNCEYVVIHNKPRETESESISNIIDNLKKSGYQLIYAGPKITLYIFYSPHIDKTLLEKQDKKFSII